MDDRLQDGPLADALDDNLKRCSQCGVRKDPTTEFSPRNNRQKGLQSSCKACRSQHGTQAYHARRGNLLCGHCGLPSLWSRCETCTNKLAVGSRKALYQHTQQTRGDRKQRGFKAAGLSWALSQHRLRFDPPT